MNLPNKLTLTRILLVPVFMIFASLTGLSGIADGSFQPTYYLIAGIVFAAASFTDFLDGHLARKWNMVTDFGKFADPLADKLRRVRSLTKILGNDNAFIPLTEDERAWVQKVTQKDQRTVGESVGYMEDGKLVIVEGPLKGREDWVRKVNHRKRLAYLEMPMGGRTVRAQAGLQMVSKAQGKLLDREK